MGYVIAAAILALIIIGFTRRTVVVLAGLVALGFLSVAIYLASDARRQRQAADLDAAVLATVVHGEGCTVDMPIRLSMRNTTDRVLERVTFDMAGYREGHSIPLYRTRDYLSDRILAPQEEWSECYPLPAAIRGTDTSGLVENPPETLRWSIENLDGTFG